MADQVLSVRIQGQDALTPTLGRVLAGVRGWSGTMARAMTAPFRALTSPRTMSAVYNLRAGVSAIGSVMQRLETGAKFGTALKSLQSLSGSSSQSGALALARRFQSASEGALSLAESMGLANQALVSGTMTSQQIATAMQYVSRYAKATGKDLNGLYGTAFTGLSRGSALFLDDLGILTKGMEGVQQDFEALRGKGAWETLLPDQQKAEVIRQAIAEMEQKMGRLGVSSSDTALAFDRIRASLRDVVDLQLSKLSTGGGGVIKQVADFLETLKTMEPTSSYRRLIQPVGSGLLETISRAGVKLGRDVADGFTGFVLPKAKEVGGQIGDGIAERTPAIVQRIVDGLASGIPEVVKTLGPAIVNFVKEHRNLVLGVAGIQAGGTALAGLLGGWFGRGAIAQGGAAAARVPGLWPILGAVGAAGTGWSLGRVIDNKLLKGGKWDDFWSNLQLEFMLDRRKRGRYAPNILDGSGALRMPGAFGAAARGIFAASMQTTAPEPGSWRHTLDPLMSGLNTARGGLLLERVRQATGSMDLSWLQGVGGPRYTQRRLLQMRGEYSRNRMRAAGWAEMLARGGATDDVRQEIKDRLAAARAEAREQGIIFDQSDAARLAERVRVEGMRRKIGAASQSAMQAGGSLLNQQVGSVAHRMSDGSHYVMQGLDKMVHALVGIGDDLDAAAKALQ